MRLFLIFISIIIIISGCSEKGRNDGTYREGKLEYKITYPKELQDKGMTALLPDEMITYFKDDNILLTIKGGFGLYHLRYLSRASGDTCFTLFQLFDNKLYARLGKDQPLFVFKELGKPEITLIKDSVKVIAGFTCKKAVISFPGNKIKSVNAYYTDEIGRKKPNINTPFEKIPGVLMEFNFFYKNLSFNLKANKFTTLSLPASDFNIPNGYKETSENEIEGFIATLLQ